MNPLIQIKPAARRVSDAIRSSPSRLAFCLIAVVLVCFGLSPTVQAGTSLGAGNTADGAGALNSLTTGIHNTAEGYQAQFSNAIGNYNTATGSQALKNNTGSGNSADGFQALYHNTTGGANTATGWRALFSNTTGGSNTANGLSALYSNTSGIENTASGISALLRNTTGSHNTAIGDSALESNTTGNNNIALGAEAGRNLTTGIDNIHIGNFGVAGETFTIRIGQQGAQSATFIAGINLAAVTGTAVVVSSLGQLGVAPSSQRFKDEIKPMDKASEAILALKPVTFRYKKELDPQVIAQFGLVAEEVEKVNPDLVARDRDGKPYTVRYEAVNAMLLNEFLKEHRIVQELKSTVSKQEATAAQQRKEIKALTAALKEQASQIQKVSAQLEASKPAPQMVVNNQ